MQKNNQSGTTSIGQLLDKENKIVASTGGNLIHGSSTNSSGKTVVIDGKRTL